MYSGEPKLNVFVAVGTMCVPTRRFPADHSPIWFASSVPPARGRDTGILLRSPDTEFGLARH